MSENTTKQDLCHRISRKLKGKSINAVTVTVDTFLDEILNVLSEGQRIEIRGFGVFTVKEKKERLRHNPRTGQEVLIPDYKTPHFKFSRGAKNSFESKIK